MQEQKKWRKFGADVIRVKGNYENSLNECIKQSTENNWQIVQDVAWEDYKLVPKYNYGRIFSNDERNS